MLLSVLMLLIGVHAQGGTCPGGSECTEGSSLNITNSTGACINNPFIGGHCEVCSTCHAKWPSCPCCQNAYDEPNSCSNCYVTNEHNLVNCGNHPVSYDCDKTNVDPCSPRRGTGGTYKTLAECRLSCHFSYNCQNIGHGDQCIAAPQGTTGTFANLSACNASCSTAPLSPCGRVKPAQCKVWQEFYDATGSTPPYPGAPNSWKVCGTLRDDPCACGGTNCDPTSNPICVTCANGDITIVYLHDNGLTGTIPSSLKTLTELTTMGFDHNSLTGTIPSSLGLLTKLTLIDLTVNQLSGTVPPLPFAQYTNDCRLDIPGCIEPKCNHFKCPLPPGSDRQCIVHCT
jgi:hypothetical protein